MASPSNKYRPGAGSSRPGSGGRTGRPGAAVSRPGRALAALAVLLIVLFAGVLGGKIGSPGQWHKAFKVQLAAPRSRCRPLTRTAVRLPPLR